MLPFYLAILVVSSVVSQLSIGTADITLAYRRLLYQIAGEFNYVLIRQIVNNQELTRCTYNIELSVLPINTTLFPNKETFYVRQVYNFNTTVDRYLMTLQNIIERMVLLERHYFLPGVVIPDEIIGSTFFNTLTMSSFNTSTNNCNGYVYATNDVYSEDVGTLNICELNREQPPSLLLSLSCNHLFFKDGNEENYTSYDLSLQSRAEFPSAWTVSPCDDE